MVQKIELRFNPDGECRQVAIDFILQTLKGVTYPYQSIKNIINTARTLSFLKKNGFKFVFNLPLLSIISPITWLQMVNYGSVITFSKEKFNRTIMDLDNRDEAYSVLYHSNSKTFYNINEPWTHCIAFTKLKNGTKKLYDPLYKIIEETTPNLSAPITIENLNKTTGSTKLLIWI